MELDLAQVRAFVTAADCRSFGRAAQQLHLTQQALSKRIARLEASLGTLFIRQAAGITLTERGARLLPAARELLVASDTAVRTARAQATAPLRVDVWGHQHPPYALVHAFASARPDLVVEMSMRRNLPVALASLQRGEIDAVLGNISGLRRPLPKDLTSELVTTTPLAALLSSRHPLSQRPHLEPDDLRQCELWWPVEPGSPELAHFAASYTRAIGARLSTIGRNLGVDSLLDDVRSDPSRVTIISTQWALPPGDILRRIPIQPTPHYPWYVVHRAHSNHPAVPALLHHLRAEGQLPGNRPDAFWLPSTVHQL